MLGAEFQRRAFEQRVELVGRAGAGDRCGDAGLGVDPGKRFTVIPDLFRDPACSGDRASSGTPEQVRGDQCCVSGGGSFADASSITRPTGKPALWTQTGRDCRFGSVTG